MNDEIESYSGHEAGPRFSLEPVQLQFQIASRIKKLLVSNNFLYLVLIDGLVYRINLDSPETVDKIAIELSGATVKQAYLDRKGYHLIVQSTKDSFYYLHYQSTHYKELSKMRELPVVSISFFDKYSHKNTTGPMVVSTSTGIVYEVNIESKKERIMKQIWKSRDGIKYTCVSSMTQSKGSYVVYRVLCALTNNKIVQFCCTLPDTVSSSSSSLQSSFEKGPISFNFNSLIHITSNIDTVAFLDVSEEDSSYQITYGRVDFKSKKELSHLKLDSATGSAVASISLTKYYIMILTTRNELLVFNQLSGKEVSKQNLSTTGNRFIGFSSDKLLETYWLYSSEAIYEVLVENENTGIWRLMMEKKMFDEAISTLKNPHTSDAEKYHTIRINQGKFLLKKGSFNKAAKILAETSEPLEEITLKFIESNQLKSLRIYLSNKLKALPKTFYMQKVIISSWLVELYVEGLNQLDVEMGRSRSNSIIDTAEVIDEQIAQRKEKFLREFYSFLDESKNDLDKDAVYQIILSHNRKDELLYFANSIKDYNFVLNYYINLQKWEESLKVLSLQKDKALVYKYSTLLFVNYPVKTCDTWIRLIDDLEYLKLLPALLTYNQTVVKARRIRPNKNQALRFLNFLIEERKVKDRIVHNSVLSILIRYPNLKNEDPILKYLEGQHKSKSLFTSDKNDFDISFDPDYILRLCLKYHRYQSAIYIFSMMGEYEEAVDLALDHDLIEYAVLVTDKPAESSIAVRKRLWLKISAKLIHSLIEHDKSLDEYRQLLMIDENILTKGGEIKCLLKYLMSKCEYLKMKDLLPLFPDFMVIDNFKEEVVKSLQDMSSEMSNLSLEMTESIAQSSKIGQLIKDFKKDNFQIIEPYESCMICRKILTTRKFIVFPCYHSFHQDCLVKDILRSNDYKMKSEVYKLQKRIVDNSGDKKALGELRAEIDNLLSRKCCLCSDIKINEIEEPLVGLDDKEEDDWKL
ncbi:hypothetical protein FOA43_000276 [Brettanomyces nanus]|uniref:RING-type domain-containing protein n=1 Tax=Eeniella nana TaxID=13502 RepID=A0A875RYH7_EENNA|nr:uncharacterized protein FOA43_000276 [Brettanomyces nanus]QPG72972.1 hypothetical protein FOA43_000276 [Brettanomyces nanus]